MKRHITNENETKLRISLYLVKNDEHFAGKMDLIKSSVFDVYDVLGEWTYSSHAY